jgi:predicted Zn finger-like uncharacterized protein
MSLITRCPGCETSFKVVPDQLRLSEGWVRCGQCDLVFDAALHLQVPENEAPPVAIVVRPPPLIPPKAPDELPDAPPSAPPDAPVLPATNPVADEVLPLAARLTKAAAVDWETELAQAAPPTRAANITFLSEAPPQSRWHKPWARRSLAGLTVALTMLLMGQLLVQERERLLTWQPDLVPMGLAACRVLNCTIAPQKLIDSLAIESSSFTLIAGDTYRWDFVLKNTASAELAFPAIELSLTDSLDRVWMRRIFLPQELGVSSPVLLPGAEWSSSMSLKIKTDGQSADQVAGYRILALYP